LKQRILLSGQVRRFPLQGIFISISSRHRARNWKPDLANWNCQSVNVWLSCLGENNMEEMKDSGIEWVEKCPAHWKIMANKHIMKKVKNIKVIYENEDILSLTMKGVIVRDLEAGGKMPTSFDGYQILYPNNLLMCLFDYDVTPRCIGLIKKYGLSSPAYSQFEMKNQNYEGYYYYYYLMIDNTKALLHLAKNLRHSFTEEQLGLIHAPVPPIKEQIAIANLLDEKCSEIDRLFADIQSEIDSLEEYRMSIINEVLRCGISGKSKHKKVRFKYIATVKANLVPPTFFLEYHQVSPENIAIVNAFSFCAIQYFLYLCKTRKAA